MTAMMAMQMSPLQPTPTPTALPASVTVMIATHLSHRAHLTSLEMVSIKTALVVMKPACAMTAASIPAMESATMVAQMQRECELKI